MERQVTAGSIFSRSYAIREVYESFSSSVVRGETTPYAIISTQSNLKKKPVGKVVIGSDFTFPVEDKHGNIVRKKFQDMDIYHRNLITFHEMLHILISYHPSYLVYDAMVRNMLNVKGYGSLYISNLLSDFVIDTLSTQVMIDLNTEIYFKGSLRQFHYYAVGVREDKSISEEELRRPVFEHMGLIKKTLLSVMPISIVYMVMFQYLYIGKDNKYIQDSDEYLNKFFNFLKKARQSGLLSKENERSINAFFHALSIFKKDIERIASNGKPVLTRATYDWKGDAYTDSYETYNENFNEILRALEKFEKNLSVIPPLENKQQKLNPEQMNQQKQSRSQQQSRNSQRQCKSTSSGEQKQESKSTGGAGGSSSKTEKQSDSKQQDKASENEKENKEQKDKEKQKNAGKGKSGAKEDQKQREQNGSSGSKKEEKEQKKQNQDNSQGSGQKEDKSEDADQKAREVITASGHDKEEVKVVEKKPYRDEPEEVNDPIAIANKIKKSIKSNAPITKAHLKDITDHINIGRGTRGGEIVYYPIPEDIMVEARRLISRNIKNIVSNRYIMNEIQTLLRLGVIMHVKEKSLHGSSISIPQVIKKMPDIKAGESKVPVFKQYHIRRVKKLKVLMLYDVSGSMANINQWLKFATNYLVNTMLGALFDVQIVDFSNSYRIEKNKSKTACGIEIESEGGTMPFDNINFPYIEGILKNSTFDMAVFISDYGFSLEKKFASAVGVSPVRDCSSIDPDKCGKTISKIIRKLSGKRNIPVMPICTTSFYNEREILVHITKTILRTTLAMNGFIRDRNISL